MRNFKINEQSVDFLKQALNEGTFSFPVKNIVALLDMLKNLEEIKEPIEENK